MNEHLNPNQDSPDEPEAVDETDHASEGPTVRDEVEVFATEIDSLLTGIGPVMVSLQAAERDAAGHFREYAEKHGIMVEEDTDRATYRFQPPYGARAGRLSKRTSQAEAVVGLVPRIFVLALVGQFDAFLGRLLRALFLMRPELMASSDRSLTLAQLLEAGSLEGATNLILDKEIETVLRKSRSEQFDWMENKFGVKLRNGLESWPTLVEVTERRNLFAHTNGIVSDQYLAVCHSNNVALDEGCEKGNELTVPPSIFERHTRAISRLGSSCHRCSGGSSGRIK